MKADSYGIDAHIFCGTIRIYFDSVRSVKIHVKFPRGYRKFSKKKQ